MYLLENEYTPFRLIIGENELSFALHSETELILNAYRMVQLIFKRCFIADQSTRPFKKRRSKFEQRWKRRERASGQYRECPRFLLSELFDSSTVSAYTIIQT